MSNDVFWTRTTPGVATVDPSKVTFAARVAGSATDGSADIFGQADAPTVAGIVDDQLAPIKADGSRAMEGPLELAGDPTQAAHAANKDYVDTGLGLKTNVSDLAAPAGGSLIGITPPFSLLATPRGRSLPARAREDMRVTDFYPYADQIIGRTISGAEVPQARATGFTTPFDDAPFFQKAFNQLANLNLTRLRVPASFYQMLSQVTVNSAIDFIGDGNLEAGTATGWNSGGAYGQQATGTWLKMQTMVQPTMLMNGGASRGSRISNFAVVQDQPVIGTGWTPNNYAAVFGCNNMFGGMDFERLTLLGVTNGISCYNGGRFGFKGLRGQVFKNLLNMDLIQDVVDVDTMRFNTMWSGDGNVISNQQSNLELVYLGRVDGFTASGRIFVLGAYSAIHFAQTASGYATDVSVFDLWGDLTRVAVVVDAPMVRADFFKLKGEGDDYNNNGTPLANSSSLLLTANSGGGIITVDSLRSERVSNSAIRNLNSSAVRVRSMSTFGYVSGGQPIIYSPTTPVEILHNIIYDPSTSSLGAAEQIAQPLAAKHQSAISTFASDSAAGAAGLVSGDLYVLSSTQAVTEKT